jgi:hypothetical protein
MREQDWIGAIVIVTLACLFGVLRYEGQKAKELGVYLGEHGVLTSASVEREPPCGCSDYVNCYYLSYRFTLPEQKGRTEYRRRVAVTEAVYKALAQIRFVDVRYLPGDPQVSCLEMDCAASLATTFLDPYINTICRAKS